MSTWFRTYGFAEVYPDLVVGAYPLDAADVQTLGDLGIRRILNLVEDSEYRPGAREGVERALGFADIEEARLQLTDFGHLPAEQLEQAVTTLVSWMEQDDRIYVHCRAGWQRSASVAAGAIAVFEDIDIEDALHDVQTRKPTADPLPHQRRDLASWYEQRRATRSE